MDNRPFRAKLYVFSTAGGGRRTPFRAGYRPQFHIPASEFCTNSLISRIEVGGEMAPGATGVVEATLLVPECLGAPLDLGTEFTLREGHRMIACGVIEEYI
jgi:elongation factor Tu